MGQTHLSVSDVAAPSFERLVSSLYSAVLYNLGEIKVLGMPETPENLLLARFNLGLLIILKEKCRGNLTDDEAQFLEMIISNAQEAIAKHAPAGVSNAASD